MSFSNNKKITKIKEVKVKKQWTMDKKIINKIKKLKVTNFKTEQVRKIKINHDRVCMLKTLLMNRNDDSQLSNQKNQVSIRDK